MKKLRTEHCLRFSCDICSRSSCTAIL